MPRMLQKYIEKCTQVIKQFNYFRYQISYVTMETHCVMIFSNTYHIRFVIDTSA